MEKISAEYQMSKDLQKLITEIGATDKFLKKTTADELVDKASAIANRLEEHGLSKEKHDEFIKQLNVLKPQGVREIFRYISNFALAGTGPGKQTLRVLRALSDHIKEIVIHIKGQDA
jgi:hypothetical protein